MRRHRAIFLDKDGTLITDVPYNVDATKIKYEAGVFEALQLFRDDGYKLVVVSNQSGVAKGFFAIESLETVSQKLQEDFLQVGVQLDGFYFCPHHPCGIVDKYAIRCDCRKPKPGLILRAAAELNVDLSSSWMIGDILNDVEAGNLAGCNTILINNGNETEWHTGPYRIPHHIVPDFYSAAEVVLKDQTVIK